MLIKAALNLQKYSKHSQFCHDSGLSVCVFAPSDRASPSCWLLIWLQVSLLSSLIVLSLKALVHSVFVVSWTSFYVFLCLLRVWTIKDCVTEVLLRSLVPCYLVNCDRRTDQIQLSLCLYPPFLFPFFYPVFFLSVVPSWISLSTRNSFCSCWREMDPLLT